MKLNGPLSETMGGLGAQEVRNERALAVYNRVQHKLTGRIVASLMEPGLRYLMYRPRLQPRRRAQRIGSS